jgi:hypothetical protein
MSVDRLVAIASALGADVDVVIRWHGERLDRLVDESHARLVDLTVTRLAEAGWQCEVETTFSIWGERGSIDVLAFFPNARVVLVVEVKSVFGDLRATIAAVDRKCRLARAIAADRNWQPSSVAGLLCVEESRSNRRVVEAHRGVFDAAFPLRGVGARRWLASPEPGTARLLAFVPSVAGGDVRQRSRIRLPRAASGSDRIRAASSPRVAPGDR